MRITCPNCMFEQNVPDEKIPPHAQRATCPKCKHKFKFRQIEPSEEFILEDEPATSEQDSSQSEQDPTPHTGESESKHQEHSLWSTLEDMGEGPEESPWDQRAHATKESSASPWENLQYYGFFPGFYQTVKRIMLTPHAFFQRLSLWGLGMPLAFFILVSLIQALATFIWNMSGIFPATAEHGAPGMGMGMMGAGSILILIFYPLFMAAWVFVASGVTHAFLLAFQAGKSGFEGTFRATAYGSAPLLLAVLPLIGPFIGALWSLVVTVIGYKCIHDTYYSRVVLALIAPVLIVVLLGTFMAGIYN